MISVPEAKRPKSGRILEITIVISVALHLLLGGVATFNHPWLTKIMQRLTPQEKRKEDMSALSTAITLEKRTRPVVRPPSRQQPQVRPVPPQPRVVPRVAVVPKPVVKPQPEKPHHTQRHRPITQPPRTTTPTTKNRPPPRRVCRSPNSPRKRSKP